MACDTTWMARVEETDIGYYGATGTDGPVWTPPQPRGGRPDKVLEALNDVRTPPATGPKRARHDGPVSRYQRYDEDGHPLDAAISEALGEARIARLLPPERVETLDVTPVSPFHQSVADLARLENTAPGPTERLEKEEGTGSIVPIGSVKDVGNGSESLAREATGALRTLSRVAVQAFDHAADQIDRWIEKAVRARRSPGDPLPEPVASPGDESAAALREKIRRQARNRLTPSRALGWCLWAVCLAAMIWLPIQFRAQIEGQWPVTKRAYGLLPVATAEQPYSLSAIDYRYALSTQGEVVELRGVVRHDGEEVVPTPLVLAEAVDADGAVLASWLLQLPGARQLQPSMELPFMSRTLAPEGLARMRLTLIDPARRAEFDDSVERVTPGAQGTDFFISRTTTDWAGEALEPPVEMSGAE